MADKPKILIADSQFLVIDSLTRLIESENKYLLCGVADSRKNILKLLKINSPDLLITDINLIDYDSPEDLRLILGEHKYLSILILTNMLTPGEVGRLLNFGIKNIALKTDEKEDLLTSIEMAIKHRKQYSNQIIEMLLEKNEDKSSLVEPTGLTPSEIEIVKMVAAGYSTKEIALKKHISFHTVVTHRKNIFRKLEINNVTELIRFAVRQGLIDYIDYNI
jgi:DNA-binding NarL/FixJ family response regulator